jgi:two-component system CheB/CheR fusion protein
VVDGLPLIQIVGLGASAGGIEALGQFFDAMPPDSGCAFVVVLHLDPERESEMAHILSTHTAMSVVQIEDGMRVAANHVYVIAPNTDVQVRDGGLHISRPSEPRGQRHPVDVLFRSLARTLHERAIAIVLSGTGRNGTDGLKEIRAEGGMTIAQSLESAKFDGMPSSAISAGLVDHVLLPQDMPAAILAFVKHGYAAGPAAIEGSASAPQPDLDAVIELLRLRGGRDFRAYKQSTLRRRIHRRLGLRNIAALGDYVELLRGDANEIAILSADLMISVTEFFRDTEAWKALATHVLSPLIAEREAGETIRVWCRPARRAKKLIPSGS